MKRNHLTSLVGIVAATALGVIIALTSGWSPVLGLDLQGGIAVVLQPSEAEQAADAAGGVEGEGSLSERLDTAIEVLRQRVDALGVAEPEIVRQGDTVVVQLPGVKDAARAQELVGQTAELRFRPVIRTINGAILTDGDAVNTELENLSGQVIPTDELNAALGDLDTAALGFNIDDLIQQAQDEATEGPANPDPVDPDATDPESTDPATTDPTAVDPSPDTTEQGAGSGTVQAAQTDEPDEFTTTSTTPDEGSTTTTEPQGATTSTSSTVPPEPVDLFTTPSSEDNPDAIVILPDRDVPNVVYVLGPARVRGNDIAGARARIQGSTDWFVTIDLTGDGNSAFNDIAGLCFGGADAECPAEFSSNDPTPSGRMGIVLDSVVVRALGFQTGSFDGSAVVQNLEEADAKDFALLLRFGALPVQLEEQSVQTVSATLGRDSLQAGLIAGLVGLALVAIYMVSYYRLLGIVAILSLALSGAMLYVIIAYLGENAGLALTLAGATGIIVSIGVAVDSNVVYYERLKEEYALGRSLNAAVERGFGGAWATIVRADIASLIGAAVLYWFTVGPVRGFALFLGISTVLDMVSSYFFMRPLVVWLGRSKLADNPKRLGMPNKIVDEGAPA